MDPVRSAGQTVPLFGGNRGGRPRKDGLKAGSPEAIEADREKHAERMRRAREREREQREPPPLPPAAGTIAPANPPAMGPASPPADAGAPSVSGEGVAVPWQADSLRPLFEQLIEAAEENRVGSFVSKCAQAGILVKLIKEIEADAHFPKAAKLLLVRSLPRLAAKLLNKAGLSAEYEDEVAVVSALLLIAQNDRKLSARLDAVIESSKQGAKQATP